MNYIVVGIIIAVIWLCVLRAFPNNKSSLSLPPGPPPKPLIRNLLDLPLDNSPEWLYWFKHKDLYGPISSLGTFGRTMIILNDYRLAHELLDKKSAINSSRPPSIFVRMCGWGGLITAAEYSSHLRDTRRVVQQQIGSNQAIFQYNDVQYSEVARFLLRMLNDPGHFVKHIRKEAGAIILKIVYGYTIEPHSGDPLVNLADETLDELSKVVSQGSWLVEALPILQYVPSWLPGGRFTRYAQTHRKHVTEFSDHPYAFTKWKMTRGHSEPSFVSNHLSEEHIKPNTEEEHVLKWAAASMYVGGSETTVSTLTTFILVMALYPQVQRKAQEEIDRVVGTSRLPDFDDRQSLPYIDALIKEALRWHPIAPMGVPHSAIKDSVCEGYLIPKGATLLTNIWAFTHDPELYHEPMEFKPERFLSTKDHAPEQDPRLIVFGFGRRACPGRTLADSNIYLTIAQTLAVYDITKPIRDGKEVDPQPLFGNGVVSHPAPFDVSIKPRSAGHEELIRALEKRYPWEESHADELRQAVAEL
ncbi:cytochrome P450 [Aspergillus avenaceus]|uniref:Cytochrome P450 n=1 Tax=Aspergillus avenaceus TaxID=36643 RepID=A0A5N6U5J6_ASPAV|nr:cytochrome P450 [Aspergillus avenaceus]